jgi:3-phosphoshikimate 1-carboxyvinyltransferase
MFTSEFLDLPPLVSISGTVRLPGSKSISNRVLLLAGLAQGTTAIHDLLDSDDTRVMLDALAALGCTIVREGAVCSVTGLGGQLKVREAKLFLGNAGTAMRPLTAALAVLAKTQGGRFELSGVPRMHERPIGDLVDALRQLGCHVVETGQKGFPPLQVGTGAAGPLQLSAPIRVRGDVSSQFLTALLLALPLLSAEAPAVIEVEGELISKPYIDITLGLLARFGVQVEREGYQRFRLPQGTVLQTLGEIHVEADASSASYFIALGAIAAVGAPLRIEGVGLDSIQGDIRFIDAARAMGAEVRGGPSWLEVRRGVWPLSAVDLDCNHIPDAAMTLAAMALFATGRTRLRNIASWRVKETDRIAAMACELRKLGAEVLEGPDFIEVSPPTHWRAAAIHTYDDHRMAMALSLAAFSPLTGSAPGWPLRIEDPKCVAKTFPDYFEVLFAHAQAAADSIPVLAIDGPTASGKGTLSSRLAAALGYHLLDSGALYRATALAAFRAGVHLDDEAAVARIALAMDLQFHGEQVLLAGEDITAELRDEATGLMASQVSAWPAVRRALHEVQLAFRKAPGLVADGRDMGSVVFPSAPLKVFLTANAGQRAERRHQQLIQRGISSKLSDLLTDLQARDERDKNRETAPCKPAEDAVLLDNSALSITESVNLVLGWWQNRRPF